MAAGVVFLNDPATTQIYTLSLHDALPISPNSAAVSANWKRRARSCTASCAKRKPAPRARPRVRLPRRSEEHTSELQSQFHLVCRLLLEKKKKTHTTR